MLELRPSCEHCRKILPPESPEAMICSFECTFCQTCATEVFQNVCPNCGGGFVKRPVRPKDKLINYPASRTIIEKRVNPEKFKILLNRFKDIDPSNR